MRSALCQFGEVFACLTPFERKELIRLVLRRAEVGDRQIVLELYGTLTPEMAAAIHALSHQTGSPGRIRTYNLAVNSRPLYH